MNIPILARLNTNERWLMLANMFAKLGIEAVYFIGFTGYAAYGFGGRASIIATVMIVLNFAHMVGSGVSGIVIDKIGPRRSIYITGTAVLASGLFAQLAEGRLLIFVILAAWFGFFGSALMTSLAAFSPYLVEGKDNLARVNSLITVGGFAACIVGPAIGGVIATYLPALRVFLLLSVSMCLCIVVMSKVHERLQPDRDAEEKHGIIHDALTGWRLIKLSHSLRFYLLVGITMWFAFGAFDALESLYYKDVLLVPIAWLGWVNTIIGVGLLLGAFWLSRLPGKHLNARMLIIILLAEGLGTVLYVGTNNVWWSASGAFALGVAFGIGDPLMRTLIQADSPLAASGRILGTIDTIRVGLLLIPLAIAPTLSHWFGVQPVLIGAGVLTILLTLALIPMSRSVDRRKAATRHLDHVNPFAGDDS